MPPRRKPTKAEIKAAADRAEGKKTRKKSSSPLDPPSGDDPEQLEEMPGGVMMRRPRSSRGGRPTLYKPEYAKVAKAMVKRGATISEIADAFGVANSTVHLWQQTHTAFMEAFLELNESYDARIERTLADRAMGYTYDAVKIFNYKGEPLVVPYREHVPPDISAIKLWLSNRKPEQWKNRDELEVTTNAEAFLEMWKGLSQKKKTKESN